jgi:DNA-binding CsgD family transcriptional regulator
VVLVAEDLQWADDASLEVWERLSQAVGQLPLLLVGSLRSAPVRDEVQELVRGVAAGPGVVLEVGPLAAGEVAELAADLLGARWGRRLAGLASRAGGNPLYVRELLDALVRDGEVVVYGGVAELVAEPDAIPQTLAAAIGERLGVLSVEAVRVLRCAAVLGQEFSVDDLAGVTGRPVGELAAPVAQAVAAGVVAPAADLAMVFRHGLIRQAVYEGIPVAVRGALHRQAARALAQAGEPPERVAAHLMAAPATDDEWTSEWLAEAAPVLVYRAPAVAAQLLRRSVRQLPSQDHRREILEAGLVTAASQLLDGEEVERVARSLLARTTDPDRAAEVSWLLSATLAQTGRLAESIEVASQALARTGTSDVWSARLLARQATAALTRGPFDQGEQALREALAVAERIGDGFAIGFVLHYLSMVSSAQRDYVGAQACVDRALEVLRDDPGFGGQAPELRLMLMANRAGWLQEADRLGETGATIREAMALAEQIGTPRLMMICTTAAEYYFEVGQWDDALTVLETANGLPTPGFLLVQLHGQVALIAAHRDDWATALQHLAVVQDQDLTSPALRTVSYALLRTRALAAEREGDLAAAVAVLAPCLDEDLGADLAQRYVLLTRLARLAAMAGDVGTVQAAAEAAAEDAAAQPLPLLEAAADVCRGLAAADPGPLLAAAAYYQSAGRPFDQAQALEEAAVLLAGQGELAAARGAYADAVAGYQAVGAVFDLRRADVRLRGLGIRRGRPGRRRTPDHGWEALTQTERVIARLVAGGKSNPDIAAELVLSRRTVQTHVSHILAKLDARSRADIIRHAPQA